MTDIVAAISWWIIIQVLGLAVWPLAFRLFRWLPDRGYSLAKPLGLLLVSYLFWLLVSLGIAPNAFASILIALLVVGLLSWLPGLYALRARPGRLMQWLRAHWKWLVIYEIVFALAFIGWAILRAYSPDVITGEKSMELAFINAIKRSPSFPPYDPWLSGYSIVYYYFGFVMMSLLNQLTGVTVSVGFSLSNALWFALSAGGVFGLVTNLIRLSADTLKRAAVFGMLGAVLLLVMGNYEAPLEVARVAGWGSPEFWTQLDVLDLSEPYTPPPEGQPVWPPRTATPWWWRASSVIHDYPADKISPLLATVLGRSPDSNQELNWTIDEFPQFSFFLGDMHPHVLNTIFVLLIMGLALNLYRAGASAEAVSIWRSKQSLPLWLLYPVVLGGISFVSTWDFPTCGLLLIAAWGLGRWRAAKLNWLSLALDGLALGALSILFYLPFYLNYTSQASGIMPNFFNGTRLAHFLIVVGPFIVLGVPFGLKLIAELRAVGQLRPIGLVLKSIGLGCAAVIAAGTGAILLGMIVFQRSPSLHEWFDQTMAQLAEHHITLTDHLLARLADAWVPLLLAGSLAAIFFLWRARRRTPGAAEPGNPVDFVLLLFFIGALLSWIPEFGFIVDESQMRMNTVFKYYYQTWIFWSSASAYGVYYLLQGTTRIHARIGRWALAAIFTGAIGLGLLYPVLAFQTRIEDFNVDRPTLDGFAALARSPLYPNVADTLAAVKWLNENAPGAPVLLEATDDIYSARPARSRVSTWSGLPAVLGWYWHEEFWRGGKAIPDHRLADLTTIYTTTDQQAALDLLHHYQVRYIFVGPSERKRYPPEGLAKFDQLFSTVFQQSDTTIYQVPR